MHEQEVVQILLGELWEKEGVKGHHTLIKTITSQSVSSISSSGHAVRHVHIYEVCDLYFFWKVTAHSVRALHPIESKKLPKKLF